MLREKSIFIMAIYKGIALFCLILLAAHAHADTILLKNGGKIRADEVWAEKGLVKYKKYGTVIGIPEGNVERIEYSTRKTPPPETAPERTREITPAEIEDELPRQSPTPDAVPDQTEPPPEDDREKNNAIETSTGEIPVPRLRGRINDYAGILSPTAEYQLNTLLEEFEQAESTQIVVLTIQSLEGEPIEAFGMRVAEKWKIGQEGLNNGAILIVSKDDRKLRIEVGYGLTESLSDVLAGRIIRNVIVPRFRQKDFDQGITDGVNAVIAVVSGEFKLSERLALMSLKDMVYNLNPFEILLIALSFLFIFQLGYYSRILSTIAGGVLFPMLCYFFFTRDSIIVVSLTPVGCLVGYIFYLIARKKPSSHEYREYEHRRRSDSTNSRKEESYDEWRDRWDSHSSGSGSGYSGGGGSFGGGGASGEW